MDSESFDEIDELPNGYETLQEVLSLLQKNFKPLPTVLITGKIKVLSDECTPEALYAMAELLVGYAKQMERGEYYKWDETSKQLVRGKY